MISVVFHLYYLEIPFLKQQTPASEIEDINEDAKPAKETDALLPTTNSVKVDSAVNSESWWKLLGQDLANMQTPFELLIISCMAALLLYCLPAAARLWPTSKALLWHARPTWLVPLAVVATFVLLGAVLVSIICRRATRNAP